MSDIDVIEPVPADDGFVTLTTGTVLVLQPLKARQFFKLLKIVTRGAGPILPSLQFSSDDTTEQWVQKFLAVIMMAIPESEQETLEFIASMVKPAGLIEGRALNKQDKERNDELWDAVERDLGNPELEDLLTVIEAIVNAEGEDLKALGKRLMSMFELAKKTGQLK